MPFPVALLPVLLNTIIGAKLVTLAVGWITAPTSASSRRAFIGHVENVRESLHETKFRLLAEDDVVLLLELEVLRDSAGRGWTTTEHTAALMHVLKFLSWAHGKATAEGAYKITESHLSATYDALERMGLRFLDIVLGE